MNKRTSEKVKKRAEAGSILLIALWSLCLLSTFAVILGYGVRSKIMLIRRLEERDKLHFIAQAGINKAIAYFKTEISKDYDTLNDAWSNNPTVFKDINVGDGVCSIISQDESIRYGLVDEESKININSADLTVLKRLFQHALGLDDVQAQDLAASIIDWRDSDSELSIPLGSAEDRYYTSLEFPYEAKDDFLEVLDEVLLVKGITQDYFDKIKEYITIYGNGRININTAPRVVLLASGLSEKITDEIMSFRNGKDGIAGSGDDNMFISTADIVPRLSQYYHLGDSEIAQITYISERYLGTGSSVFMARSIARLNNRKNTAQIICVLGRSGHILYWQEL